MRFRYFFEVSKTEKTIRIFLFSDSNVIYVWMLLGMQSFQCAAIYSVGRVFINGLILVPLGNFVLSVNQL